MLNPVEVNLNFLSLIAPCLTTFPGSENAGKLRNRWSVAASDRSFQHASYGTPVPIATMFDLFSSPGCDFLQLLNVANASYESRLY